MEKTIETEDKINVSPEAEENRMNDDESSENKMDEPSESPVDEIADATEAESEETKSPDLNIKFSADQLMEKLRLSDEQNIRLRAEFANYKKRIEREQIEFAVYLKGEVLKEFMPILDDFKMMLETAEKKENEESVLQGARMIYEKFLSLLKKQGVQIIEAVGEEFDPNLHEALMMQPTEDKSKHNRVLQVFQDGFTVGDKLLRPTKVIVGQYQDE
ncbi:MAG: nucleotide exchange factor GrpE [Calditrichaeota bacterium]|nr:nucleotide exchange factor GrpE [Calditrichota bacterium]MCB0267655.1 nucleotide exchange factor GrpE [Calditrichota bacterium]MCB0285082.1 nucleotide exchange factor GrpE [Calditrichota bacterium]MCB0300673.1 nucleotide exchange factor GrpE [Calditrichota bacterium]MCB9070408.1 nucleotide exchange factor GrpE [Calditrichia bacterium]